MTNGWILKNTWLKINDYAPLFNLTYVSINILNQKGITVHWRLLKNIYTHFRDPNYFISKYQRKANDYKYSEQIDTHWPIIM